jgi:hypothetical protein
MYVVSVLRTDGEPRCVIETPILWAEHTQSIVGGDEIHIKIVVGKPERNRYNCRFFFNGSSSTFRAQATYSVPYSFFTVGRTPWTGDQSVARPLPKHRTTQTQNKRIHTPNIHAMSAIPAHDPSVRASEDSSYLRPRRYCDR